MDGIGRQMDLKPVSQQDIEPGIECIGTLAGTLRHTPAQKNRRQA
jgi:hypothetical protein